jgi:hypothetical protein
MTKKARDILGVLLAEKAVQRSTIVLREDAISRGPQDIHLSIPEPKIRLFQTVLAIYLSRLLARDEHIP